MWELVILWCALSGEPCSETLAGYFPCTATEACKQAGEQLSHTLNLLNTGKRIMGWACRPVDGSEVS